MVTKDKILILTSGNASKLDGFPCEVCKASFNDVWYKAGSGEVYVGDRKLSKFKVIYFRMVGKSLEVATLVADYALEKRIRIVDGIYERSNLMPVSLGKALEIRKISRKGIKLPKTYFNNFKNIKYPFVVKSTTGQRGREVWLIKNDSELEELKNKFEKGKFYFSQKLVPNAKRIRALVVGDRVIGAIVRQTKWNRDETKETLNPIPRKVYILSIKTAKAAGLDVCGVDILVDDRNKMFVIEANAAPSWKLINRHCGVKVEDEIIKFIQEKF